jgi:competence protein ComEA
MDPNAPWRAIEGVEAAESRDEPAPQRQGQMLLLAAAALIAGSLGVALVAASQQGGAVDVAGVGGASGGSAGASLTPPMVVVEVAGAVVHPGVYELPAGSRVADAIEAAGGYSADVDPRAAEAQLNLAAKLQDAQLIRVPRRGEAALGGPAASGSGSGGSGGGLVDLNTATAAELDTLPGVGPVTAQKIIAARQEKPFASVDELVTRKIVAASTLEKMRSLVTVG